MNPPKPSPPLPVDLKSLTDDDLAWLVVAGPREIEERKSKREAELFAFIREQATVLGLSPARLRSALFKSTTGRKRVGKSDEQDGRSRVKPKYWNPKDHAQRWAGRGAPPPWYTEHLAAGGTKEDMCIPEGAV